MEYIALKNTTYGFAKDFKHDPKIRASFNKLTQATYGFDMEYSYLNGYWSDNYIPYSLLLNDEIISNVSINKMEFLIGDKKKIGLQIGTVMTDTAHRNQGLNKYLMERVLEEWKQQSDFIYLFANDSVLDFYPKFNFEVVEEYQCSKSLDTSTMSPSLKKLNMAYDRDKKLLEKTIIESIPIAKLSMRNNAALIMFSCMTFKQNSVYYLEDLNAVIIAEIEGETLYLQDIFSKEIVDVNEVISLSADKTVKQVVLGFTPLDETGYKRNLLQPDDALFVLKEHVEYFKNKKWMFPVLSHA